MKEAAIDWSSSLSSQLTDMVWGADASFSDIASSFGKMLTNMMIQKQVAEPLMNWMGGGIESFGSWLFSAHGNAFDKSGVKAYAHGGTFTNKIVDQPTLFAHGGGLGVMGELGKKRPEVIAPLFRASNGDMGVKAVVEGGGGIVMNNVFNIDASGTGDESQDRQMANMISSQLVQKVKEVMRDEMRVGGMLNNSINRSDA